jgi:hypothetical protein
MKNFAALLALALAVAPAGLSARAHQQQTAGQIEPSTDYYTNSSGHSVHRPMQSQTQPRGATAQCADGSWSFSQHRRGTCSYHGGVSRWLQ